MDKDRAEECWRVACSGSVEHQVLVGADSDKVNLGSRAFIGIDELWNALFLG